MARRPRWSAPPTPGNRRAASLRPARDNRKPSGELWDDRHVQAPDTRYAKSGDLRLAYQQWGEGPPLLVVPPLLSNMEVCWEHEYLIRMFELLGRNLTITQFDKR